MDPKKYIAKYKDIIPYVVFGVLTTTVNIVVYWLLAHPFTVDVMPATIIAWTAAVLFAYTTNRRWVFHSEAHTRQELLKEMISFFACRLLTGIVDWGCMFLLVDTLHFNDVVIKTAANGLVIVLNYVASKMLIFRHGKKGRK